MRAEVPYLMYMFLLESLLQNLHTPFNPLVTEEPHTCLMTYV